MMLKTELVIRAKPKLRVGLRTWHMEPSLTPASSTQHVSQTHIHDGGEIYETYHSLFLLTLRLLAAHTNCLKGSNAHASRKLRSPLFPPEPLEPAHNAYSIPRAALLLHSEGASDLSLSPRKREQGAHLRRQPSIPTRLNPPKNL